MRGEQNRISRNESSPKGSSPHARGAVNTDNHRRWCDGIIPACAGSRDNSYPSGSSIWDHPRMRGEQPITS